jgi:hypothetical protein
MAFPQPTEADLVPKADETPLSADADQVSDDLDTSVDNLLKEDEFLEAELAPETPADEFELDLDLDLDEDHGREKGEQAVTDDELPDLGDLDDLAGLDDDLLTVDEAGADLEEAKVNLEAETETEGIADQQGLDLESEEIDIADLELELEDSPASGVQSDENLDDLDFELDLDLDSEAQEDEALAEDGLEVVETDELDLSDLEDIADQEETSVSELQQSEAPDELEPDVATYSQNQTAQPAAGTESIDELDLSDLEEFVDSDETALSRETAENAIEDLELDLDMPVDEETQATDAADVADLDDELDFSDLDQFLESDDLSTADAPADQADEELELQFDIDEQPAVAEDTPAEADADDAVQEDDILDIEKMLEEGEEPALQDQDQALDETQELPLEMEAALDDASKASAPEDEFDFDLESAVQEKEELFGSLEASDERLEAKLLDSGEVDDLDETGIEEAEFKDSVEHVGVTTDDFATDEFAEISDDLDRTDGLSVSEEEVTETATKPKSRSKTPVLVTILLFFLAIGILIIPKSLGIKIPYISDIKIPYLSDMDLKIPFLSDLVSPEEQDVSGNLKMIPLEKTISSKFINNSQSGQLLVIRGKIKNDYDQPRSFVKVTGKLYQKGGKLVKSATVYCGNILSDPELSRMGIAAIKKKMGNKFGEKKSNLKIETGKMVPFMIVFDKLPRNLDEYTVEVAESSI